MREGVFTSLSHTLSFYKSLLTPLMGLKMLRVIFEVNKVHINDKTSQSSECVCVGGKRTDNRLILRSRHTVHRGLVMLEYKNTQKHREASTARQWSEE